MSDEVFFDGRKYVSANSAAQDAGFTRDYVAKLCREGKIVGKRVGKNWYVNQSSLTQFILEQEYTKASRNEALARERASEYKTHEDPVPGRDSSRAGGSDIPVPRESHSSVYPRRISQETVPVYQRLSSALAQKSDHALRHASAIAATPAGITEAALRATHVPAYTITPLTDFLHRIVALTLAFTLTFGTYALVDPAYARALAESLGGALASARGSYIALTSGGFNSFAQETQKSLTLALEHPGTALAAAGGALFDSGSNVFEKLARAVHTQVDSFVYSIAFPQTLISSLGSGSAGSGFVSVQVEPYAPPQSLASLVGNGDGTTGTTTIVHQAIIERIKETERVVTVGGVTQSELDTQLNQLNNKLVAQIYGITAAGGSTVPASGGFVNNIAISQRIDQLSGTNISNPTISGGTISGATITGGSVTATSYSGVLGIGNGGTGTSSAPTYGQLLLGNSSGEYDLVATSSLGIGGISLSDPNSWTALQTFAAGASTTQSSVFGRAYFGGTATSTFDVAGNLTLPNTALLTAPYASSTAITLSSLGYFNGGFLSIASSTVGDGSQGGGLTISGGATTTGNAHFTGTVGIGTTTPWAKLSVSTSAQQSGTLPLFVVASTTNEELFTVLGSGNVGIGTTSPYAKLSVAGPVVAEYFHATSSSATSTFAGGSVFGSNAFTILQNGRIGVGTAAPTTAFDIGVNTRVTGDFTIGGGSTFLISATGPVTQTGTGQVTFAGNVDATNGLDVTTGNFSVGGSNFLVAPSTGNTTIGGTLGLSGALAASSTAQVTGASIFYSTLSARGALTASAAGTGLSVTNDATVGGTLGVTGAGTFSNGLTISSGTFTAGAANFSGAVSLGSNRITSVSNPSADQDAATKSYVDSVAQGLTLKDSVRAGTTANITLSGEQTIDGVSLSVGDRVLVKDQSDQTKNGIYDVAAGSWSRSTDADEDSEVSSGMFTFISEGTTNANSGWVLTTANPITVGTSLLSFTQFSGAGQIVAGTGLTKSGNTLNVEGTANRITANADSIDIASTYVGQTSITTVGTLTSGSLGSGFGNINIGNSTITAGVATFSSIVGSAITGSGDLTVNGNGSFTSNLTVDGTLTAATTSFLGDVSFNGKKITGLADPTSAQEAATKAYVDAIAQGLTVKASVQAATVANITLSGEQTIDGVSIGAGDRVLVKDQSTGSQNGIYVASAGAWSRSTDADENSEVITGLYTFVEGGTANANTGWSLITPATITLDTTSLTFTQFSGSAEVTAGDGLTKSGNTLNIGGTTDRITVNSDSIDIAATYTGQGSIVTVGALTSGSIGVGFGAINIGTSALTAGAGTFNTSLASVGTLSVGGTATTSIVGNSATSTFSGGVSLASGNVNLASGGNFLINDLLVLNATTLGSSVVSSFLTSVGVLDSGSITTGFGDINIGANTLDAGTTTVTNLIVTNTSSSTFAGALGIGTTTPWAQLSVNPNGISGPAFAIGSSTASFFTVTNGGKVGVGTTTPFSLFSVAGNGFFDGALTATNLTATGTLTTAGLTNSGTFSQTGLASFLNASTSLLSVTGTAYFGGTATSTFDSAGNLSVAGTLTSTGLISSTNASTSLFSVFSSAYFGGTATSTFSSAGALSLVSNGLTVGTNQLVVSSGNVGIGTTTPERKLTVASDGSSSQVLLVDTGASADQHYFSFGTSRGGFSINSLTDALATTTRFTISSAGNIGIGTTSPYAKLSVTDTVSAAQSALAYDATRYFETRVDSAGDTHFGASGGDFFLNNDNFWVCTGGSITVAGCPSGTPTGQGNLVVENKIGVGTTTMSAKLTIETQDSTTDFFQVASSTAQSIFRINANGNVGIGTSTPWAKLSVGTKSAIVTTENALTDGATIAINWLEGNQQRVTLGGNRTVTFSNYTDGQILRLVLCQDGTGSRTITWPAVVLWQDGTAPTLTTTANKCDLVSFIATQATSTLTVFGAAATNF